MHLCSNVTNIILMTHKIYRLTGACLTQDRSKDIGPCACLNPGPWPVIQLKKDPMIFSNILNFYNLINFLKK